MSITDQLKEPFDPKVIHWRVGATNAKSLNCKPWEATSGIALAYLNARDVMKRLDEVCGDNWQARHPYKGYCEIGIKIDGEGLWRGDGAGETDVEGEKGQFSDALKRAAVLWGVGRYLYYLPNKWCDLKNGKIVKTPDLPSWAKPPTFRFAKGEKEATYKRMMDYALAGDERGCKEVLADYRETDAHLALWTLFNSRERSTIKALTGDAE